MGGKQGLYLWEYTNGGFLPLCKPWASHFLKKFCSISQLCWQFRWSNASPISGSKSLKSLTHQPLFKNFPMHQAIYSNVSIPPWNTTKISNVSESCLTRACSFQKAHIYRDANLRRSKIWRLSLLYYTSPQNISPKIMTWEWIRTIYRHECFTGIYTTRQIHKNYIRDPSGLFSIISHVSLSMT